MAPALAAFCSLEGRDPLPWILGGGDDYELLFAAPRGALETVGALTAGVPVARVGHLEPGEGAVLRDGERESDIDSLGHDHFEGRP